LHETGGSGRIPALKKKLPDLKRKKRKQHSKTSLAQEEGT